MTKEIRTETEEQTVVIPCKQGIVLEGSLSLPVNAISLVIFVHGSGSSRFSKRNRHVAHLLNEAGIATLLFDLLTPEEEAIDNITRALRFDIPLLARRLTEVTHYCQNHPDLKNLSAGYFGASTGGGAALMAAAGNPSIRAVVSRGGRPDLALPALPQVTAPTLLIVGGDDLPVIEMNRLALSQLTCLAKLEIVNGATHLFEEPGTLEEVARLAREWFLRYLGGTFT